MDSCPFLKNALSFQFIIHWTFNSCKTRPARLHSHGKQRSAGVMSWYQRVSHCIRDWRRRARRIKRAEPAQPSLRGLEHKPRSLNTLAKSLYTASARDLIPPRWVRSPREEKICTCQQLDRDETTRNCALQAARRAWPLTENEEALTADTRRLKFKQFHFTPWLTVPLKLWSRLATASELL